MSHPPKSHPLTREDGSPSYEQFEATVHETARRWVAEKAQGSVRMGWKPAEWAADVLKSINRSCFEAQLYKVRTSLLVMVGRTAEANIYTKNFPSVPRLKKIKEFRAHGSDDRNIWLKQEVEADYDRAYPTVYNKFVAAHMAPEKLLGALRKRLLDLEAASQGDRDTTWFNRVNSFFNPRLVDYVHRDYNEALHLAAVFATVALVSNMAIQGGVYKLLRHLYRPTVAKLMELCGTTEDFDVYQAAAREQAKADKRKAKSPVPEEYHPKARRTSASETQQAHRDPPVLSPYNSNEWSNLHDPDAFDPFAMSDGEGEHHHGFDHEDYDDFEPPHAGPSDWTRR